ncbi:MAG TPA: hypothetical protein VGM92_10190, partial [Candidatus Kapabacteria bacterium]
PPAVGKLTVAEQLAERTGFKIFQNNPTVRAVEPLFEFGTQPFQATLEKVRLIMLREAIQWKIPGLIFTFCFDPSEDEAFITEMISTVESEGGSAHLVQLIALEATLLDRVENESRVAHKKVIEKNRLRSMLKQYALFTPYAHRKSLVLDTSQLSVEESVERIVMSLQS